MFINKSKPSQEEANDEMVWQNDLLATDSTSASPTTKGFTPSNHNVFVDQDWNKSLPEGYRQTGQTNNPTPSSLPLHNNNNLYQFGPSSTSHFGVGMGMSMNMMTSSFNTSFDSSNMSSPSAGATWSEVSPEYEETRHQHEAQTLQDNMNNNGSSTNGTSSASGSFHRPSTTESSNTSNGTGNGGNSGTSNDAQSFSPATDASWDSSHSQSPVPVQTQDNYMDMADNVGPGTNDGANMTSPNGDSDSNMPAYPGQGRQQQHRQHQHGQHQQQPTGFGQHFSEAAASLQGSTETDGFYNTNVHDIFSSPPQQQVSDLPFWSSGPSSQPAITFSSPPFVSPNQGEQRWFGDMSDGDNMSSGMPSSPIGNLFHNGGMTAPGHHHHPMGFDGLPSPTASTGSFNFDRSSGNNTNNGGGGVSLPHQNQHQQFPPVGMFSDGGQLASSGDDPFVTTAPGNFSLLSSSPPAPIHNTPSSGGEILFRGPISHRTVFDDPPSSSSGPQAAHAHHGFDGFDSSPILRSEGLHNSISPSSLWMNNNNHNQHNPRAPHPSPHSSPLIASGFYHQTQQMAPLPLDFGIPLHPHYAQLQQTGRAPSHRRSLPHTPPRRGGLGMGMSMGGNNHPHPLSSPLAYNPLTGMEAPGHPSEIRPAYPRGGNHPSFGGPHHGHHGQDPPHSFAHRHQMIRPNAIIPSQHPDHVFSTPQRRQQQPFQGSHPYHHPSLGSSGPGSSSKRRENHGRSSDSAASDAIKRHRAKQDDLLVRLRNQGKSYKQIRQIGKFTEAESTLRGRYRTLTKSREERVRRPEWTEKDLRLLEQAVRTLAKGPLAVTYSSPKSSSSSSASPSGDMSVSSLVSPNNKSSTNKSSSHSRNHSSASSSDDQPRGIPTTTTKVPWKQVAQYIINHGGSYKFGNATVRKRWEQYMRDQLARGKDLQQPFWTQRSKKSPYNTHQQSSMSAAHSGRIAVSSHRGHQGRQGGGYGYGGGGSSRRQSAVGSGVKAERDQNDEPPYDDWLDMDALGKHDHAGDGDEEDYDISDADDDDDEDDMDDDEEDYDEDEGSDQEYKGY